MSPKTISYFLFLFSATASFLFFTIQLASSKIITPIFGGVAWVWILTMLFYQLALFVGYIAAGAGSRRSPEAVLALIGTLMVCSALIVPPPDQWGLSLEKFGMVEVIYVLIISIGLPAISLASSTIVLQNTAHSEKINPWQLYFYSNIGSILAIILYPFVLENLFSTGVFMNIWKILLGALGVAILLISLYIKKGKVSETASKSNHIPRSPLIGQVCVWLLYSALPSAFLAVVSAFLTEDVASMPTLWALPLGVFMLAFALPFAPKPIIARKEYHYLPFTITLLILIHIFLTPDRSIPLSILVSLIAVFYTTWIYAGTLIKNRPDPKYLHYFYTSLALGGFAGNLFVSVLSPFIFDLYMERWIVTVIIVVLPTIVLLFNNPSFQIFKKGEKAVFSTALSIVVIIVFAIIVQGQYKSIYPVSGEKVDILRSMYGPVIVTDEHSKNRRTLYNGNTLHGYQNLENGKLTTKEVFAHYYTEETALDDIYNKLSEKETTQNIAVIGLGAGGLNFYSYPGIHTTFFEIDKNVEYVAKKYFTYLEMEDRSHDIEIGDGRFLLNKKPDGEYSMILVDAFTGISIPRHLLTHEAIELYTQKLRPDGILLLHASNRHLDIEKIVNLTIHSNNLHCYINQNRNSVWVAASRKPLEGIEGLEDYPPLEHLENSTWSDDFTPLIPFIKK